MEASLRANQANSTDILGAATTAYQQGKITKNQLMGVINALDEQPYQTRAYTVPDEQNPWGNDGLQQVMKLLEQFGG